MTSMHADVIMPQKSGCTAIQQIVLYHTHNAVNVASQVEEGAVGEKSVKWQPVKPEVSIKVTSLCTDILDVIHNSRSNAEQGNALCISRVLLPIASARNTWNL